LKKIVDTLQSMPNLIFPSQIFCYNM